MTAADPNPFEDVTVRAARWETDSVGIRAVRETVFVREQEIALNIEYDGLDPACRHVLALAPDGRAVGTGRIQADGHIGRLAVLREWRRRGIGSRLLEALIQMAAADGLAQVYLNAQTQALAFYEATGFGKTGPVFQEAGIPHQKMVREL